MAESVRAKLLDRRELFNNIRSYEFQYKYHHDGKESSNPSFNLTLADYDFEIMWTIYRIYTKQVDDTFSCKWTMMELQKKNKHFYGSFTLYSVCGCNSSYDKTLAFDSSIPGLQLSLIGGLDNTVEVKSNCKYILKVQIYQEHQTHLTEAHNKLLGNENLSDVTFIVGSEEIAANKCILSAHSVVFESMFEIDMVEKKTSRVEITDIEPATFKLLIRYIYCGELDYNSIKELQKLALAADKYSLESLVNLCCYRLNNKVIYWPVIDDMVVDTLIVADQLRQDFLKKTCIEIIIKYKDKVIKTESYKNMIKAKRADLLSEIFSQMKIVGESESESESDYDY